jgi:hypothetical protein
MSLSPDVTPFVPRQSSAETSQLINVSQSSSWKLSADVAEFVPSWSSIGNAKLSLTQKTKKSVSIYNPHSLQGRSIISAVVKLNIFLNNCHKASLFSNNFK